VAAPAQSTEALSVQPITPEADRQNHAAAVVAADARSPRLDHAVAELERETDAASVRYCETMPAAASG